jgi:adenylyltransferase/sulfurtransferase
MLPELDIEGQQKLQDAKVLVVGVGGLGSPVAMYLAAAGVGSLLLVDHDQVELSNLQRQIVHASARVGLNKAESARATLQSLNPHCRVEVQPVKLDEDNGAQLVAECDVIVDCSDNFAVRFLLNRLSLAARVPLVSGAAIRLDGQLTVYDPRVAHSPCYRCLFAETGAEDMRCTSNGVLSPLVGVVGSMQALETIKLIAAIGTPLVGRLLLIDSLNMRIREVKMKPDPECPACSGGRQQAT